MAEVAPVELSESEVARRVTVADRVSLGPCTGVCCRLARACDSRSAITMANSPSVIRGRTARLIRLQNGSRRDYKAHDEKG